MWFATKEIQIKTLMSWPYVPTIIAKNTIKENPAISPAGKDMELPLLVRMSKNTHVLENNLVVSCKVKDAFTIYLYNSYS